jgi:metallophosphoesterase (TIGR00282 family)
MKILIVGDIVGSPGRQAVARVVTRWREGGKVDFVVANAENAAGGKGLTRALAQDLVDVGVDVLTLGDHTWDQKEARTFLDKEERVIRPLNFSSESPGRGIVTVSASCGVRITVVNAIGRVFMKPVDCPFHALDRVLKEEPNMGNIIIVDFHAEATSEKIAMGRYLDGRASVIVGTHTHVQTSDEVILPKGSAYITDLGMTGPKDSVIGMEVKGVTEAMVSGMPERFEVAKNDVCLEGVVVDVEEGTGRARRITRIRESIE